MFPRVRLATVFIVCLAFLPSAHASIITGNIAVYDGSTILGYVRDTFDGQNSYTYGSNIANALLVQIDTSTSVFDILALNAPDAGHPYFGSVGGSGGYNFSPGQLGYTYLAGTGHTNAGSTPSFSAGTSIQSLGYNGPAESMIWSLAGDVLTAQWTNANGATAYQTQTFYDPAVDFLGLVGDFNHFNSIFPGENASLVTLRFTGDLTTATPEPESFALLSLGLASLLFIHRRRQA